MIHACVVWRQPIILREAKNLYSAHVILSVAKNLCAASEILRCTQNDMTG